MLVFAVGVFIVLHGLVHLLYYGQSGRFFELQPGMIWPDGSWAFARLTGDQVARSLASICCVLAAAGFAVGGLGLLTRMTWWQPLVVGSAIFSIALYSLFWDGTLQRLDNQGFVGILINLALLVLLLVVRPPQLSV